MTTPDHAARSTPVELDQTSKMSARGIPSIGHLAPLRPSSLPTTLLTRFSLSTACIQKQTHSHPRCHPLTMPCAANLSSSIRRARCPRAASRQSAILHLYARRHCPLHYPLVRFSLSTKSFLKMVGTEIFSRQWAHRRLGILPAL